MLGLGMISSQKMENKLEKEMENDMDTMIIHGSGRGNTILAEFWALYRDSHRDPVPYPTLSTSKAAYKLTSVANR